MHNSIGARAQAVRSTELSDLSGFPPAAARQDNERVWATIEDDATDAFPAPVSRADASGLSATRSSTPNLMNRDAMKPTRSARTVDGIYCSTVHNENQVTILNQGIGSRRPDGAFGQD
jgi:hypothetical protein